MLARLLLLLILTPLIEIWLLLAVSDNIGSAPTFALVILTGVVGAVLAKRQGLQTWQAIQQQTRQGQVPAAMVVDAFMILIAGVLLMTPGILTDCFGFSLLIPPVRAALRKRLRERFRVQVTSQGFQATTGPGVSPEQPSNPDIIDVEYERRD